ncbi:MAG: excisionase, partial [Humibacillus sp.]|nr:excisionase [Humibacillus sp.]
MGDPASAWITTTEASQRLGVKRATLYAYVSRGLLRSERRPGQQESLFDRAQIDAMASSTRPPGAPAPMLRFRSIATGVSSSVDGDLLYRGVPLAEVIGLGTVEEAAAVVLGSTDRGTPPPAAAPAVDLRGLPLERRMPVALQLLAGADPFAGDTDPARVRAAALPLITAAVGLAAGVAPVPDLSTGPRGLASLTLAALGGDRGSRDDVRVLRVIVVALLDHGLTASTVAARVAASTRA